MRSASNAIAGAMCVDRDGWMVGCMTAVMEHDEMAAGLVG